MTRVLQALHWSWFDQRKSSADRHQQYHAWCILRVEPKDTGNILQIYCSILSLTGLAPVSVIMDPIPNILMA